MPTQLLALACVTALAVSSANAQEAQEDYLGEAREAIERGDAFACAMALEESAGTAGDDSMEAGKTRGEILSGCIKAINEGSGDVTILPPVLQGGEDV